MFRYFFSSLLIWFFSMSLRAQTTTPAEEAPSPKRIKVDTVKNKYFPTGLRVGMDVISLVRSGDHSFKGWELNFDTDLSRYYFTVDYGYWATNQSLDNFQLITSPANPILRTTGQYKNDGYYLRIGADVNFLLKDPEKNMFFLGLRYGVATFSENVQYTNQPTYPIFQPFSQSLSNATVSGSWLEVTTGLRIKVYKEFWMGYTARLKFAPSTSGATNFNAYDMPGYGIIEEAPYWGFNYQLFWRFAWKKPAKKNKS